VLACALLLAGTAQAGSSRNSLAAMGMVYKGLKHVAGGPCGLLYQIDMPGPPRCTHGPDPAPLGVDVRKRPSLADLGSSLPPRALFATSPTASLVPCTGTGQDGPRVQAIYAHPPGTPGDYANVSPLIQTWASQVDETYSLSAAETGGSRHVRFVTTPACQLSVLDVVARADSIDHTFRDLESQGFTRSERKYLIWMDAGEICGIGESYDDPSTRAANKNNGAGGIPGMIARIDRACWGEYTNLARGSTEAHELTHTLGAVLSTAPNATHYGHCEDGYDVMCYEDGPGTVLRYSCPLTHQRLLDCGHDDYFSTNPAPGTFLKTHWNAANNRFLEGAPTDIAPPLVHAQAAKVKRSKTVKLRFDVSDDSGESSVALTVSRGKKQLRQWGQESVPNGNYSVSWKAPAKAQRLDFCAAAQDETGNKSATVCAVVKVT
jgi:hypothetical protein